MSRGPGLYVYIVVFSAVVAGLGLIFAEYVRPGLFVIAGAMFCGSLARFALPGKRAGLLDCRGRVTDGLILAAFAVALAAATFALP